MQIHICRLHENRLQKKQKEFELYSDSRFLKVMPRYIFAIFANLKGNERLKFKVT